MQFLALFVRNVTNEMELVFCNTIKEFIIFHYHHKLSICLILHLCQNTYGTVYHFLSSHRHRSLLNLKQGRQLSSPQTSLLLLSRKQKGISFQQSGRIENYRNRKTSNQNRIAELNISYKYKMYTVILQQTNRISKQLRIIFLTSK